MSTPASPYQVLKSYVEYLRKISCKADTPEWESRLRVVNPGGGPMVLLQEPDGDPEGWVRSVEVFIKEISPRQVLWIADAFEELLSTNQRLTAEKHWLADQLSRRGADPTSTICPQWEISMPECLGRFGGSCRDCWKYHAEKYAKENL